MQWQQVSYLRDVRHSNDLMVLGGLVVIAASCVLMIRFSVEHKEKEQRCLKKRYWSVIASEQASTTMTQTK